MAGDLQEWHQRKNIYLICNRLSDTSLFTRKIRAELQNGFQALAPVHELLWRVRR